MENLSDNFRNMATYDFFANFNETSPQFVTCTFRYHVMHVTSSIVNTVMAMRKHDCYLFLASFWVVASQRFLRKCGIYLVRHIIWVLSRHRTNCQCELDRVSFEFSK